MTALRVLIGLVGLGVGGYGARLLSENSAAVIVRIVGWALAAVVVHDLLFAPLCAAVGMAGHRILPRRWQAPIAVAGLCSVVLTALVVPVFGKPGLRPDNHSVLDRNYPVGLSISLGAVWAVVGLYLMARRLPVGQDEMVERQRTDDVESQPESP